MSDARWFEIDKAVAAASRHFEGATVLFARLSSLQDQMDRYALEMGFMHAMHTGHSSLESALLRILELCGEEAPTGARWHADLIARASSAVGSRPAILTDEAARAANNTRQFRALAAHAYDNFDRTRATGATDSASSLVTLLPQSIARFRQTIDP